MNVYTNQSETIILFATQWVTPTAIKAKVAMVLPECPEVVWLYKLSEEGERELAGQFKFITSVDKHEGKFFYDVALHKLDSASSV
jgi:hypothetical protein